MATGRKNGVPAPEIEGVVYLEPDGDAGSLSAGDFVKVEITGMIEDDLIGRPIPRPAG